MIDEPITVEVHPNGQVFVNAVFVAEVELAPGGAAGGARYRTQTLGDLHHELTLHRMAVVVLERLDALVTYLEHGYGPPTSPTPLDAGNRADFAGALVTGLTGDPGELTGRRCYRDGHRAGVTLRALRDHLAAEAGARAQ